MVYSIERKTDLSGAMLIVRFPEEDLDKKALCTIENDPPPFLIPFSYRRVDGMIECTYRPGSRSKLQYRFGSHGTAEYIALWDQVLQPLLDCGDWFLKPFSFVLDVRELYTGREGGVSYLYVPSIPDCESFERLHGFVMELSQQNSVTDPALENRALRMMMQDFQPKGFLDMLHTFRGGESPARQEPEAPKETPKEMPKGTRLPESLMPSGAEPQPVRPAAREVQPAPTPRPVPAGEDDIQIQFPGQDRKAGKKEKKPLFGGKKEKPEKPVKEKKEKKPLFGGKKSPEREIILGAAAEDRLPERRQEVRPQVSYEEPEDAVTQVEDTPAGMCCLRLAGAAQLPREIAVDLQPGQAFTIGRFDISVGRKQSSFEFPKDTRAVSRRHAAIEREPEGGYVLVDLASSAGTFVDGERLIPNVPRPLASGNRISFGTGGADYIWNE